MSNNEWTNDAANTASTPTTSGGVAAKINLLIIEGCRDVARSPSAAGAARNAVKIEPPIAGSNGSNGRTGIFSPKLKLSLKLRHVIHERNNTTLTTAVVTNSFA
jgi:hypothetical protein